MTLKINFNICVTLLSDKRKCCHLTQSISFIKVLEQNETKYQEQSAHIMKQNNFCDAVLD